jgi:hypothetical protein
MVRPISSVAALLAAAAFCSAQAPVGSAFTYQGKLQDNGQPANGTYDFNFVLMDAASGGAQIGPFQVKNDVPVSNGLFTVTLDYGAAATNGSARWLEIYVRPGSSVGFYTTLAPRQALTPAPYAMGVSLPLAEVSALNGSPLFSIRNTGTGGAISGISATGTAVYGQTNGGTGVWGYNLGTDGSAGFFRNEGVTNSDAALRVETTGTGPGIWAFSSNGMAGAFGITNSSNGQPALSAYTDGTGNAGSFVTTNASNSNPALYAAGWGTGPAFNAVATGTGRTGYFLSQNSANPSEAVRVEQHGTGPALTVQAGGSSATAVNIASGALRVQGMGIGTPTCLFVHRVTTANMSPDHWFSYIDHPQCNGKPGAVLMVTPNMQASGFAYVGHHVNVGYNSSTAKWFLYAGGDEFDDQGCFNVMVVTP